MDSARRMTPEALERWKILLGGRILVRVAERILREASDR
jgi:hypothetical protein